MQGCPYLLERVNIVASLHRRVLVGVVHSNIYILALHIYRVAILEYKCAKAAQAWHCTES